MKPRLLFVTNGANDNREDPDYLIPALGAWFDMRVANPAQAVGMAADADICLLRNVWPVHEMKPGLLALAAAVRKAGVPAYNPLHENNFVEDKSYLVELAREGLPVIPTALDVRQVPVAERYIIKPIDGCSSRGVRVVEKKHLANIDVGGHVIQPLIDVAREISFFFLDDEFIYAVRTRGERWDLELFEPDAAQITWARQFVAWNALPYGLQRIDAAVLRDGSMLLMEIEDLAPFLSLNLLPRKKLEEVINGLAESLLRIIRNRMIAEGPPP